MADKKVVNSPIVRLPICACDKATTTTIETPDIATNCVSGVPAALTR